MKAALLAVLVLLGARAAQGQTMLDQEERLIELHSLLVALNPVTTPGAYQRWDLSLGVELIIIPPIDGTTGGKVQTTASDRTPLFPRFRAGLGLPAPEHFRAMVGLSYSPPIAINEVSSHLGALEVGFAWAPDGPWSAGVRAFGTVAQSKSPVTDPNTRDTLDTVDLGAELAAAYRLDFAPLSVTPFASVGFTYVAGDFTVTSDDALLTSRSTLPTFVGGARVHLRAGFEAVAEVAIYPGRMVHPIFSVAWMPGWLH